MLQILGMIEGKQRNFWYMRARDTDPRDRTHAAQKHFTTYQPPPPDHEARGRTHLPVIWTNSAGPCVIIAVQGANGQAGLGHGSETASVAAILNDADQLRAAVGGRGETMVFAGAAHLTDEERAEILHGARDYAQTVRWEAWGRNGRESYSAALLFPTRNALVLYDETEDDEINLPSLFNDKIFRRGGFLMPASRANAR